MYSSRRLRYSASGKRSRSSSGRSDSCASAGLDAACKSTAKIETRIAESRMDRVIAAPPSEQPRAHAANHIVRVIRFALGVLTVSRPSAGSNLIGLSHYLSAPDRQQPFPRTHSSAGRRLVALQVQPTRLTAAGRG